MGRMRDSREGTSLFNADKLANAGNGEKIIMRGTMSLVDNKMKLHTAQESRRMDYLRKNPLLCP